MNQEKIGNLIKKIRKDNNLTQKDLANKLGITYQAVSKWENGKNIPDLAILKQISNEFNINIDSLLEGEIKDYKKVNIKKIILIIIPVIILLIVITILILSLIHKENFEFKTISSKCKDFNITGSAAYTKDKTSIYISNVEFCGKDNNEEYSKLECNLYESFNNTKVKISSCKKKSNSNLEDYLKDIKINVDNYSKSCKKLTSNTLSLEIQATSKEGKITTYKVPINLNDSCKK